MKLDKIARDELLKPLSSVSGIVERKHTLPILSNVLLEQKEQRLWMTAMDMELQISAFCEVPESSPQAITVSARKLQDLLRALPDDVDVSLETQGSKMMVKAGRSRFNLQTLPAADYPRLTLGDTQQASITLSQKSLRSLLRQVEFAMAQQDIRYYLNGMLWVIDQSSVQLVATDGHRLAWASLPVSGVFTRQEVILPRKTVMELGKLLTDDESLVTLDILSNQVRFHFGSTEIISKVIDGKFPDYNRVIPVGYTQHIEISRMAFLTALQRAAILSNEKVRGVHLNLTKNEIKIICSNNEQEEAEEQLEIQYDGEDLSIGFNITYLLDVLQRLNSEKVMLSFGNANDSALLTVPDQYDYKYVVMPMRI
ncbi:MAG: DNA polymerase III subunit beta [Proteobacteria bacterium]|nr:DNA polymerase III subunit beta [Pseudomonadota bacterium]MCL2309133.1 DNA polymerase III subunit beta [Pseudomonadota bacterium]